MDILTTNTMSNLGLGPKLYGVFSYGRLEQFVDAIPIDSNSMFDPDLNKEIGKMIARIHTLEMPFSKRPDWLFNLISELLIQIKTVQFNTEEDIKTFNRIPKFDFDEEFEQLKYILKIINFI